MDWRSKYFSLAELTFSSTAQRLHIANNPPPAAVVALEDAAWRMDEVRELLGHPIHVDSGYRCPALNKAVRGSSTSAHMSGHAIDFICPAFGTPLQICRAIVAAGIEFDQLIQEGTWVHISFAQPMRGQCLTADFNSGGATYHTGLQGHA